MAPPPANGANSEPGLPPVQPPSGRFIARLFLAPGLIILVVVLILMGLSYWNSAREPAYYLAQLDSENTDIRWRGASDLAQILKRSEPATLRWKADAKLALDLAERLDLAFQRLVHDEKAIGAQFAASSDNNKHLLWRKLRKDRDYVVYLAGLLAQFRAPVGAPVLCKILNHDASPDLKGNTQQRRLTLWALINLGESLKGFANLPADQQKSVIAALKEEAAREGARADWARTGLHYLDRTSTNTQRVERVDETLARLADAEDQFLRKLVAMSFIFWDGEHAEATLLKLANDNGHGTLVRVEEDD